MKNFLWVVLFCLMSSVAFAGANVPDAVKNVLLQYIEDNAVRLHIVSDLSTPANVTGTLGVVTIDAGDFTIADGDTSGRKTTISAQNITATGNGTVRHWVLTSADGNTIYDVGTVTAKVVATGSVYEFASVNLTEVRDAQ